MKFVEGHGWLLLGGRYRGGADLHLFVDGPDDGGPSSTHFVVEARLQGLTESPNQCRTQCVVLLLDYEHRFNVVPSPRERIWWITGQRERSCSIIEPPTNLHRFPG